MVRKSDGRMIPLVLDYYDGERWCWREKVRAPRSEALRPNLWTTKPMALRPSQAHGHGFAKCKCGTSVAAAVHMKFDFPVRHCGELLTVVSVTHFSFESRKLCTLRSLLAWV